MTWLTWRLQRMELVLLGLILLVLGGALVSTRADLVTQATFYPPDECPVPLSAGLGGGTELGCFVPVSRLYQVVTQWLDWFDVIPLLAALLLALPVVLELEGRTYRLAWTQGTTRARWLRSRFGIPALCGLAFAALFTLAFHWWSAPMDARNGRFGKDWYDLRGTLPVGYTLFAIGLMLAVGTTLRRPVLVIILASVTYLAVLTPVGLWLRPYLIPPVTEPTEAWHSGSSFSPSQGDEVSRSWLISNGYRDASGEMVSDEDAFAVCDHAQATKVTAFQCYEEHGLNDLISMSTYHPASHYWPLQLAETGLYLVAGAALIGFAAWYVLRRIE